MNLTTDRATKKAYFSDLGGGHIIDFQFTPDELILSEGGRFADRITTGEHITDYIWLSGKPNKINLKMWVDRTQESVDFDSADTDPFSDIKRFPRVNNPRFTNFDVVNLVRGISKDSLGGIFRKKGNFTANKIDPSIYVATPDFKQDLLSDNVGVYKDVEALLHFVRPLGFKLGSATIGVGGVTKISDFKQARFTPPPIVRFFYGSSWMEGYIEEVKYSLTAMNKQLVPRRLEADISFLRTNWGYLSEVSSSVDASEFSSIGNQNKNSSYA